MELRTTHEVAAPIDWVWAKVAELDRHEATLRARGGKIARTAPGDGLGAAWRLTFPFAGQDREVDLTVARFEPPRLLGLEGASGGIGGTGEVALEKIGPKRTAMTIGIALAAQGMAAKLLLKSVALGQGAMQSRLDARVAAYAEGLGASYARAGAPRRPSSTG